MERMNVVTSPQHSDLVSDRDLRVYQTWKGSNIFWFGGRLVLGPDAKTLFLTVFLIVAPVAVFCVFVGSKLMDDFSGSWGVSIISVAVVFTTYDVFLLMLTSATDPGIIPRNSHSPESELGDGNTDGGATPTPRMPPLRDVVVDGKTVWLKYCDTCLLYRPPRASHCGVCNNCVEKFDHHCPWLGQCVAQRNYRFYYMFVFSTTLLCIYVFAFCCVYIWKIKESEDIVIWRAILKSPASIALIIYTFVVIWFIGGLTLFHSYLIITNQTTHENFRFSYDWSKNPYNKGLVGNIKEAFFSPIPASQNNFRAKVAREAPMPPSSVVASFMSPNMGNANDDPEMGRKGVWAMGEHSDEKNGNNNEQFHVNDNEIGELSPDIREVVTDDEQIVGPSIYPRSSRLSPDIRALEARARRNEEVSYV